MINILKGIVFIPLAVLAFGFVTMHLWNYVVPAIFVGVPMITFTQAIALLLLAKLLFGGFRGGHGCHRCGGGWKGKHYWHKRMERKLEGMSPEEREKFKQDLRNRCGYRWDEGHEDDERRISSESK
jgi:hypothetical protein